MAALSWLQVKLSRTSEGDFKVQEVKMLELSEYCLRQTTLKKRSNTKLKEGTYWWRVFQMLQRCRCPVQGVVFGKVSLEGTEVCKSELDLAQSL